VAEQELWTVSQVAEYFGIGESYARDLLSENHIRRVSGYPADQVRAIRRPGRGVRTDLGKTTTRSN
jgi:hypothetical protein